MITEGAMSSIEWLFENSVRENASSDADASECIISRIDELPSNSKGDNKKLVVLNISYYTFRIVVLVEFNSNAASTENFSQIVRSTGGQLEGQALLDSYAEFVNMLCGSVNRKLCSEFRHIGMSTPFYLDGSCVNYLSILNPTAVKSFEVAIREVACFRLTMCFCVASDKLVDFEIERSSTQEVESSGELEFF